MDMPADEYPRPRRRGDPPAPATLVTQDPVPSAADRDTRVRHAADLLIRGASEKRVMEDLVETFEVTKHQARRDLADVRTYAQRHLGDEDAIALFVIRKLGDLERVSEVLLEDSLDEPPESLIDSETGMETTGSQDQKIKHRQQRAASARAFADVAKTQFSVVGARSRFYSPRAKEADSETRVSVEQQEALDAFWKE